MNAIPLSEQEDNFRLEKAKEFLAYCRNAETQARIALASAVESSKRAKEKYETLFEECQKRAVARRKSGQVIVNPGY
jgi:hypothetical protein